MRSKIARLVGHIGIGVICVLMLLLTAEGCTSAAGKTKLVVWYPWGEPGLSNLKKVADEYTKTHPDIELEVTFASGMAEWGTWEKLQIAVIGGNPPDVAYVDRTMTTTLGVMGALLPLDEFATKAGIKKEDYYLGAWEDCYWKRLWALPNEADPCGILFWNKSLFREAGLDPNIPPETITELDRYAERLTKSDSSTGKITQMGIIPWQGQGNHFWCWGWAFGGEYYEPEIHKITADHPNNVKALEWYVSYAKKYDINKIQAFQTGFGMAEQSPFFVDQIAMTIEGVYWFSSLDRYAPNLDYDVGYIPHLREVGKSSYTLGTSMAIPRGAPHLEEAWDFVEWFTGPQGGYLWSKYNRFIPANKEAARRLREFEKDDPKMQLNYESLEYYKHPPAIPPIGMYWTELRNAVQEAIFFKKTPEKALADVTRKIQKELETWF